MEEINFSQHPAISEQHRKLILEELERVLLSPSFRGSKRYPAMLRYVVEQTLIGAQDDLKERTIGVEVFGRTPAYDTNNDPVVRFSAGEIRKRLVRYSEDSDTSPMVRFELPLGTYVPHFVWEATAVSCDKNPIEAIAAHPASCNEGDHRTDGHKRVRLRTLIFLGFWIALVFIVGTLFFVRATERHNAVSILWNPLLKTNNPIVLCIGRPRSKPITPDEQASTTISQRIRQPNFQISITTAQAIASMAGYLKTQEKAIQIQDSATSTLESLYGKPVVLIGADDNQWTLRLLQPLRFQFVNGIVTCIKDFSRPNLSGWCVDFRQPYLNQTTDYAILARFTSPTTNAPILVAAGVGANGNKAAGEVAVDKRQLQQILKLAPANWSEQNFEAVLKVEVVGGDTGGASVVAANFW